MAAGNVMEFSSGWKLHTRITYADDFSVAVSHFTSSTVTALQTVKFVEITENTTHSREKQYNERNESKSAVPGTKHWPILVDH